MIDFMFGMHEELSLSVRLLKILCKGCFVLKHFSTMFKNVVSRLVLQRLPLTRAVEGFFFSRALTEKVPSWQRLTRKISNDGGVFNYFIKMRDYTVKTTRPKHSLQFT